MSSMGGSRGAGRVPAAGELAPVVPVAAVLLARLRLAGDGSVPIASVRQTMAPGIFGDLRPAYSAMNLATSSACWPTTTFWGMIAPEKPPFSIAYRTRIAGRSQRTLKFGPLFAWAVRTFDAEPCVAAYDSVWQPAQRCENSTAPV